MKNILCFGDSNTFGFNPYNGSRYKENERWSGILKEELKEKFNVIEMGCNNRTCFIDNPSGIEQTGYKILPKYLTKDIDIIIIALGINDIQFLFNPSLKDIKEGLINLIKIIKNIHPKIDIILLSPSTLTNDVLKGYFSCQFDDFSIEKSKELSKIYSSIADEFNCKFIDLNKIAKVSHADGLHYEIEEHKKIANYLKNFLTSSF